MLRFNLLIPFVCFVVLILNPWPGSVSSRRLLPEAFCPAQPPFQMPLIPLFTFLRAVPVRSQAGHGQLRFLLNTYPHPCSCQSAHPTVNPSSRTQRRLTRGLTSPFISRSLSSFASIHHLCAVIRLCEPDFYENISHQSLVFWQHKELSCVFQVWAHPKCTLAQMQAHVGCCCRFCLHDRRSFCAAAQKSCLLLQKLCPTRLRSLILSSTFSVPCNFIPPPSVRVLSDASLLRLRVTWQIFSCHPRTPEAICQFQLASCVHGTLVSQSNASNGRCWPCVRV